MNIAPYKTSKDYARLWQLAKTMRVICIVDYEECRDVCKTLYHDSNRFGTTVELSARGISYCSAHTLEQFIKNCEEDHVEFFLPETEQQQEQPDPIFMSMQTFERLKSLIQHDWQREQNHWTYAGREIKLVNSKCNHDCSEHKLLDGTCAVCGKEQLP